MRAQQADQRPDKKDRDTSLDDITLDYKSLEFHFPYEMALDEQKSVNQS